MGRELNQYETFRLSLAIADGFIKSLSSKWSILEEFHRNKKELRVDETDISQMLCTALQVALIDLLRHWDVNLVAVVGFSSGEIAAAYAKGAMTTELA